MTKEPLEDTSCPGGGPKRGGCRAGFGRRGLTEPALLVALAGSPGSDPRSAHGYELIRELESVLGHRGCSDPGRVYRTLRSLEQQGAVVSTWAESEAGPARREYVITPAGRLLLASWADHLADRARIEADLAQRARLAGSYVNGHTEEAS
jgi:DNA-binding PadR family transcriptional regulator